MRNFKTGASGYQKTIHGGDRTHANGKEASRRVARCADSATENPRPVTAIWSHPSQEQGIECPGPKLAQLTRADKAPASRRSTWAGRMQSGSRFRGVPEHREACSLLPKLKT